MDTINGRILIVDDDTAHRTMLKVNLQQAGYHLAELADGDEVLHFLEQQPIDLVLLDLKMVRLDGISTLAAMQQAGYNQPVIVLTAFSSVESAVLAMKKGAFDYITKPVDIEDLKLAIARALNYRVLARENETLKQRLNHRYGFDNLIGNSPPMQEMFATLAMVAPSDAVVLISGESGTGKELVANCLHQHSQRKNGPFIKLNCAALHENLLESELFGHEAGAFTGAQARRKGRFELAHRGTIFLDEIGDMSQATQAKVLRVLQDGTFERLGGSDTIRVDVRIVAATHKDLKAMIAAGTFRQDLFFRLSVVPLHLPPLRERGIDIPKLALHFLEHYARKNRKNITRYHPEVLRMLMEYPWPGNIRELENTVERAVILCLGEQITPRELPSHFFPQGGLEPSTPLPEESFTLRDLEREAIRATLLQVDNNRSLAARKLGIARQTLLNKIREYGLE